MSETDQCARCGGDYATRIRGPLRPWRRRMTSDPRPVVSGRAARDRAARAGLRPGVAQVRLVGPPEVIDAANQPCRPTCSATPGTLINP